MRVPPVFLMGATATGKTALAVRLVERLPLEIISVDSAMVYRGMDIGTGKPSAALLRRAPHRLIDIRDPEQTYSAAEFRRDALREIDAVRAGARIPLLVGGTGLYFRALRYGLARLPAADPAIRAEIEDEAARAGWGALHARLGVVDPRSAARIHPNDPQRVQRALEVFRLTGRPLSELIGATAPCMLPGLVVVLDASARRAALARRIEHRFAGMLEAGLVEEVRRLRAREALRPGLAAMRAVGYRQVSEFLEDRCTYRQMVDAALRATRGLAKRQMTWLRRETAALWVDIGAPDVGDRVLDAVARWVAGARPF